MGWTESCSSASSTTYVMARSQGPAPSPAPWRSSRYCSEVDQRWCPSAITTGSELTALAMASVKPGWLICQRRWWTPSPSVQAASGGPGSSHRAERPSAVERPQTADRLARHERSISRRSLLAFGVVCSWGRTPPVPGWASSSAPMTPAVWRRRPVSSL